VPSAALAGSGVAGCECASVPIAGRLCARGVQPAAALAFMLAAPAVNPVVLVATAVAFPGQPQMVLARFCGSLLTSVTVGLLWSRVGDQRWWSGPGGGSPAPATGPVGWPSARRPAMTSGTPGAGWWWAPPPRPPSRCWCRGRWCWPWPTTRAGRAGPGGLAVVLAICSEADAFVAASLREFSLTARLVFLVVGPAGGCEADRHAVGDVRPPVRGPLRPPHLRRRRWSGRWWWVGCCCERGADPQPAAGGPGGDGRSGCGGAARRSTTSGPGWLPGCWPGGWSWGLLGAAAAAWAARPETAQADRHGRPPSAPGAGRLAAAGAGAGGDAGPAGRARLVCGGQPATVPGGGHEGGFQPLAAPVRGAVPMSMAEFVTRAVRDPDQSLAGVGSGWSGSSPPARATKAATG
jgi:hypothetical protein